MHEHKTLTVRYNDPSGCDVPASDITYQCQPNAMTPLRVPTMTESWYRAGVANRFTAPTLTAPRLVPVAGSSMCSMPFLVSRDQTRPAPMTGEPVMVDAACHSTVMVPSSLIRTARRPSVQGT